MKRSINSNKLKYEILFEQNEKEIDDSMRDVTKAENLVKHREEILARPKKTWFVSGKEKRAAQLASALEAGEDVKLRRGEKAPPTKRGKGENGEEIDRDSQESDMSGLNRKERRALIAKEKKDKQKKERSKKNKSGPSPAEKLKESKRKEREEALLNSSFPFPSSALFQRDILTLLPIS